MAWLNKSWVFRTPISINNIGGASTIDVSAVVPPGHDQFWDNVLSTGNDVRVTDSTGNTAVTYQITGWNYANKAATIEIDGLSPGSSDATCQAFLYWGNSAAASAAGSFTASSAKTGNFDSSEPGGIVLSGTRERPGTTRPTLSVHKAPTEELNVFIDVTGLLVTRSSSSNGSPLYEEITWVQVQVTDGGVAQAGQFDEGLTRIIESARTGRRYIRAHIKAGSDTADSTLEIKFKTSKGQTFELRYLILINAPND